ncbi:uncharacterized protein LOC127102195 [Lathyrus oleraceus]|uniref:uncharacterized protein LOC127102195 n=1 Tax=Pisum sativum TaxID=3888 RepID=UPI0021D14158|nr:uncharacterized protein LOC127102195 [Pisum sativum]
MSKENEVKLWHQNRGHLNLKGIKNIMSEEAIRGIPKLKIKEGKACGACQIRKQTKMSHPKLQHQTTSKILELLHMDLLGSMQVESLGGKCTGHEFSSPITPQQNGVVEHKNRNLQESARNKVVMEFINVVVDDLIIVKGTDVDEDVGTSSQQTDASENMETLSPTLSQKGLNHITLKPTKFEPKNMKEALTDEFWINDMQEELGKWGIDNTLFVKEGNGKLMIAQIYVGDIVFGGMSNQMVQHFVKQMKSEFEMSLVGELTYFLCLQVKQMDDTILISQSKYAKNIVKKFGLESASHKRTHATTHLKLTKGEKGVSVDESLYKSMIGSLLYLIGSRPNITFPVGVCARYQVEPKISHITLVKRILKYINGTSEYVMLYYNKSNSMFVGYYDVDWVV